MKRSQNLPRANSFRPGLEALESRVTPAVSVGLSAGVLTVTGDDVANTITITQNDSTNFLRVRVSYPSGPTSYAVNYDFASSAVQTINVDLKGGQDFVSYGLLPGGTLGTTKEANFTLGSGADTAQLQFLQGVTLLGGSLRIDVQAGTGLDTLTAEFARKHGGFLELSADMSNGYDTADVRMAGDITGGADVAFSILGGVGYDVLSVDASTDADYSGITVGYNATLDIDINGGTGDDTLTALFTGDVDGDLELNSWGGDNDDTITAIVDLLNASTGEATFNTTGGNGDDTLDHRLRRITGATVFTFLSGGSGYDTAKKTNNVFAFEVESTTTVS